MKTENLEPEKMGLIKQTKDGRIIQIGLTESQSKQLQFYVALISNNDPVVLMPEEFDLVLKSTIINEKQNAK